MTSAGNNQPKVNHRKQYGAQASSITAYLPRFVRSPHFQWHKNKLEPYLEVEDLLGMLSSRALPAPPAVIGVRRANDQGAFEMPRPIREQQRPLICIQWEELHSNVELLPATSLLDNTNCYQQDTLFSCRSIRTTPEKACEAS